MFKTTLVSCIFLSSLCAQEVVIRCPDDFHIHLRQGKLLEGVVNYTASQFKRAMVMPNTEPAIRNGEDVQRYYAEIMKAVAPQYRDFQPLMTFKITPATSVEDVESVVGLAIAGKLYPDGVTTNSQGGGNRFSFSLPCICCHGKAPYCSFLTRRKTG